MGARRSLRWLLLALLAIGALTITLGSRAGVWLALLTTPALLTVLQWGWRQGRTSRAAFILAQLFAPILIGAAFTSDPTADLRQQWTLGAGLVVGLVAATASVALFGAGFFRRRPHVFLSYRRNDSAYVVDRLDEQLVRRYSRPHVFRDQGSLLIGQDFADRIRAEIQRSDAVFAIIGPGWADARDDEGNRRLDQPDDWVRAELELAIRGGVRVVPVLIGGASLPAAAELPETLRQLPYLDAVNLRPGNDFRNDVKHLCDRLEHARLDQLATATNNRPRALLAIGLAAVIATQLTVVRVGLAVWGEPAVYPSPDGDHLLTAHDEGPEGGAVLRLWRTSDGHLERTTPYPGADLRSVSWSPDGRRLATGDSDGTIRIWDAHALVPRRNLPGFFGVADDVTAWHPKGGRLAALDSAGTLHLWDTDTGAETARLAKASTASYGAHVSWSTACDRIAIADSTVRGAVFALRSDTWAELWKAPGEKTSTYDAAWSPTGDRVAFTTTDGAQVLSFTDCDARPSTPQPLAGDINDTVEQLAWSPDGKRLAGLSSGSPLALWVWDVGTRGLLDTASIGGPSDYIYGAGIAWQPDSVALAVGGENLYRRLSLSPRATFDMPSPGADAQLIWTTDNLTAITTAPENRQVTMRRFDGTTWSTVSTCTLSTWQSLHTFLP